MSSVVSQVPVFTAGLVATLVIQEVATPPFINTKEVIIYNASSTDRLLISWQDPQTFLPAGPLTASNGMIIPVLSSVSLAIGPEGDRQPCDTAANSGLLNLVYVAETVAGGNISFQVSYVQTAGWTP